MTIQKEERHKSFSCSYFFKDSDELFEEVILCQPIEETPFHDVEELNEIDFFSQMGDYYEK